MQTLRLLALVLPLAACQASPTVNASQYACPDGRVVRAGVSGDRRLLVLVVDGRRHTLGRLAGSDGYGNGDWTARPDDLFLHLGRAGTLLPQHCRLLPGPQPGDATGVLSPESAAEPGTLSRSKER
ncbi:MAG: hypothetical protein V4729_11800 [Pseudomonadota bacterium]